MKEEGDSSNLPINNDIQVSNNRNINNIPRNRSSIRGIWFVAKEDNIVTEQPHASNQIVVHAEVHHDPENISINSRTLRKEKKVSKRMGNLYLDSGEIRNHGNNNTGSLKSSMEIASKK